MSRSNLVPFFVKINVVVLYTTSPKSEQRKTKISFTCQIQADKSCDNNKESKQKLVKEIMSGLGNKLAQDYLRGECIIKLKVTSSQVTLIEFLINHHISYVHYNITSIPFLLK